MGPTAKTKARKSVEGKMAENIKASAKRLVNTWVLTRAEPAGKVFEMTDTQYVVQGTKQDVVDMLKTMGKVSTARELLNESSTICGYRTVDAFKVTAGRDEYYFFAERI